MDQIIASHIAQLTNGHDWYALPIVNVVMMATTLLEHVILIQYMLWRQVTTAKTCLYYAFMLL